MKSKNAAPAAPTTPTIFQAGQIWKIGDVNLTVTEVGKHLVHYKRYKIQGRGVRTTLCSKPELESYLLKNNAVRTNQ